MAEKNTKKGELPRSCRTFQKLRGSKRDTNFTMVQSDYRYGRQCKECFWKQYCRQNAKM